MNHRLTPGGANDVAVSIVVPTRNEGPNIYPLASGLREAFEGTDYSIEVLFVDDSDDDTFEIIEEISGLYSSVRGLHRPAATRSGGLGGAVQMGFAEAAGGVLAVMDADLQHPPQVLPSLVEPVVAGVADLCIGSRYQYGGDPDGLGPSWRRAVSGGSRTLVHALLGRSRPVSDPLSGLFALDRRVLSGVELDCDGFKILLEIIARGRWATCMNLPYVFEERKAGRSKASLREGARFLDQLGRLVRRSASPVDLLSEEPRRRVALSEGAQASSCPPIQGSSAMRVSVIGTGYLGATHAACLASLGYEVVGVDVDERAVATLNEGRVPFFEPGLEELVSSGVRNGRLRFTTSHQEVATFADLHFICVGTPRSPNGAEADLSYLYAAVDELAPHLDRPCLVVGKSTVPVGTADELRRRLRAKAPIGDGVDLAWNPEFLREGDAVADTLRPDRLVFGVASELANQQLRAVYAPILHAGCPSVVTDVRTAELVKVSANAFLATKISFVNGLAEICEAVGADVGPLSEALALDERIGGRFLKAGLGFGGGCLPKDISAFAARAEQLGVGSAVSFLADVEQINDRRRSRAVELARTSLGGTFPGQKVAVLGASFKPATDDVRDSPALHVAERIRGGGATVTVYDPRAMDNARRHHPELEYSASVEEAAAGADLVLLATEWPEFRSIDPATLRQVVGRPHVIDTRNGLDRSTWEAAGWTYWSLGRAVNTTPTSLEPLPDSRVRLDLTDSVAVATTAL